MTTKGRETPYLISFIILSAVLLSFMAFASPSSPLPGCALAEQDDCHYKAADDQGQGAIYHNRKILMDLKRSSKTGSVVDEKKGVSIYGDEMRNVPSGPDPLHHNGAPQKRPRTSP